LAKVVKMKKSKHSDEQIIRILREAEKDGAVIVDVCRKHGISEQTFFRWRQKYGGMDASDVKKLRALDDENRRLKKLLAERDLSIEVMKEGIETC
jgi:putative transposase